MTFDCAPCKFGFRTDQIQLLEASLNALKLRYQQDGSRRLCSSKLLTCKSVSGARARQPREISLLSFSSRQGKLIQRTMRNLFIGASSRCECYHLRMPPSHVLLLLTAR